MVKPTEADVIRPAVAAEDPDRFFRQVLRLLQNLARARLSRRPSGLRKTNW